MDNMRKEKSSTVEEIYCDECGELNTDFFKPQCCMCHCDLCLLCCITHPFEDGDYPNKYCSKCWKICEPYIEKMKKEEDECDKKIEIIENEMTKACKENVQERKNNNQ